jgi:hypothetical protein
MKEAIKRVMRKAKRAIKLNEMFKKMFRKFKQGKDFSKDKYEYEKKKKHYKNLDKLDDIESDFED